MIDDPEPCPVTRAAGGPRGSNKPQPLRTLEAIRADILALEKETEGLLGEIIGSNAA